MEDKIVGPLTLVQFLYLLGGGLIIYILFQAIGSTYFGVFLILAIPIGLLSAGLAFLKIQDQPLLYFIKAGLQYLSNPKIRYWHREEVKQIVVSEGPKKEKIIAPPPKKGVEKSELEKLAHILDTKPMVYEDQQNFGKITQGYEKLFSIHPNLIKKHQIVQKGGPRATMGKTQTAAGAKHPASHQIQRNP